MTRLKEGEEGGGGGEFWRSLKKGLMGKRGF